MSASPIGAKTVLADGSAGDEAGVSAPLLEISNGIVGLYKEAFGRGPTKTRARFAGADTVLVVLDDAFTVTDRTLLAVGEPERLRDARLVIQEALETEVRAVIERALGRATVAFVTGVDVRHGMAINVCTLEPASSKNELGDGDVANHGRVDGQDG